MKERVATLVALPYSPWSEKARWALDHHGIAYVEEEYAPLLGEPGLRLRIRRISGKITIPILIDADGSALTDSYDIALWAERLGRGSPLFPPPLREAIREWNELSEKLLGAGRALCVEATAKSDEAKRESLPAFLPLALRSYAEPIAALGIAYLNRKYALRPEDAAPVMEEVLDELSAALRGRSSILDRFSYADVAMAVALQFVAPVADSFIPIGAAQRRAWTQARLVSRYAHLLQWRDDLYGAHRAARGPSPA